MLIKIFFCFDCFELEVMFEIFYLFCWCLFGVFFVGLVLVSGLLCLGFVDEQCYVGVELVLVLGWFVEKLLQICWQVVNVQGEVIMLFKDVIYYNNFYEFGLNKGDLVENVLVLKIEFWLVVIDGEVGKLGIYVFEDFVKFY